MKCWFALLSALPLLASGKLAILPATVTLQGPEARQQLLAESTDGAYNQDQTAHAKWISSNPAIASVDAKGFVKPLADGEAIISAEANGERSTVKVRVTAAATPFTWSFRNHVIPVMTKMGCNQGACHGALAGKNGLKLTLRGYDPDVD